MREDRQDCHAAKASPAIACTKLVLVLFGSSDGGSVRAERSGADRCMSPENPEGTTPTHPNNRVHDVPSVPGYRDPLDYLVNYVGGKTLRPLSHRRSFLSTFIIISVPWRQPCSKP